MPVCPRVDLQLINIKLIFLEALGLMILGIIFTQFLGYLGTLVLLLGLVGLAIQIWQQRRTYAQRAREYHQQLESYYQALELYCKKELCYQAEMTAACSPDKVSAYQYPRLLKILGRTVVEDGVTTIAPTSPAIAMWLPSLHHYFPDKISTGLWFKMPLEQRPYTIDLAYIDPAINLRIAIEVDEPYDLESLQPTQFFAIARR
ncbi:hypothetical protein [Neosynechococcus sphagnicola]|nr:hypothetical protein [Neosynechococcus sphagnicola]